ncbi:DNA primase [Candidatus Galacturonibacter soehngenii]|uniref:DNA primase n=1 Tax=Candidatus Galacturonatibacter soehngenii TaxID=2307010 RepID=A0A7V7UB66_9FIRM|nr:DNA primase [Candidatus Galacturonibacter soehngenii]KAB1437645.1 DNA primase [Candidatus Galacturonibacter soehngenii]
MFYPEDLVEEIRVKNDVVDVLSSYIKLKRKGSSYFGLCPFHNEKSPSFSVSPGKQMYYCFGCGAGGNVFTFIMEYENYTFQEAIKYLADRVGVELPEVEFSKEAKEQADLKSKILEINKLAAQYFYMQLKNDSGKIAYDYLKNRDLTDETMKRFGLGYSSKYSNNLYQYFKNKGYSDEILKQTGLFNIDEKKGVYDKFWNRVIFPIMDVNNRVIGFGGRVMGDGSPKYLNSPETKVFDKSRNLYGLNFARTSRKNHLLLCEGYMDVIALHQAGFTNAVASLGTAFTQGHANLIKRYTDQVYITYDSDGAGRNAAVRAIPILKDVGITVKIINMQPYKDPDEFIKNLGKEAFEERIEHAINSFMFELEIMEQEYDMKDPESKTKFFGEVAKKILEFPEDLTRDNYIQAVAETYHVGYDNFRQLVNRVGIRLGGISPREKAKPVKNSIQSKDGGMKESQRILITYLIEEEGLYDKIKDYITPDDFTEDLYYTVACILFEQLKKGEVNPAKIINHFTDEEEHKQVAGLFNTKPKAVETKGDKEKALHETIVRVKENSLIYKSSNLSSGDIVAEMQRLTEGKKMIERLRTLHISLD